MKIKSIEINNVKGTGNPIADLQSIPIQNIKP